MYHHKNKIITNSNKNNKFKINSNKIKNNSNNNYNKIQNNNLKMII